MSYGSKVKKFIRYGEANTGGFWGFIAKFVVFLRFGEAGANVLNGWHQVMSIKT